MRAEQFELWIIGSAGHNLDCPTLQFSVPFSLNSPREREQGAPQTQMGVYIEVSLTEGDEARDVSYAIRGQMGEAEFCTSLG